MDPQVHFAPRSKHNIQFRHARFNPTQACMYSMYTLVHFGGGAGGRGVEEKCTKAKNHFPNPPISKID